MTNESATDRPTKDLTPLFHPRSIAIIGCSPIATNKLGSWPLRNLILQASKVEIFPVNPKHSTIDGFECYPTLSAVPAAPDLVLVMVPAAQSIVTLQQAQAVGARSAIVFGAGFGETAHGKQLARELAEFAVATAMPICGPNTDGIINVIDGIPSGFPPFAAITPRPVGDVAVVSQSGALVSSLVNRLMGNGVGLTYSCAVGNATDLGIGDYLAHLATDDRTASILVYMEGMTDRQRFLAAADSARAHGKRVIVMKGGRSEAGSAAARSHTGSLVGSYDAFRALCEQHDIIVADNFEELAALPALVQLANRIGSSRRSVALISGSGAVGGFMADKASEYGFAVAPLSAGTVEVLTPRFQYTAPQNPIDLTGQVVHDLALHAEVVTALAADDAFDFVVASSLFGPADITDRLKEDLVAASSAGAAVAVYATDGNLAVDEPILHEGGVPVLPSVDVLFGNLAKLLTRSGPTPARPARRPAPGSRAGAARELVKPVGPHSALPAADAWQLLALYDIPTAREAVVSSADDAADTAESMGFPVVAKVNAQSVHHRSDQGLVELNLADADAARAAYVRLADAVARLGIDDASVVLQPMLGDGVELIVAIRSDPECGPLVVIGAGGLYTEILADRVIIPAPVDTDVALAALARLRISALLAGARGAEPMDVAAVAFAVAQLSELAVELGEHLTELEINPLIVCRRGVTAVDVLALR